MIKARIEEIQEAIDEESITVYSMNDIENIPKIDDGRDEEPEN